MYKGNKNPTYSRRKQGLPIQILHDEDYNECMSLTDRLERNVFRPQYIVLYEFVVNDNFFAYEACMHRFKQIGMYELEKTFYTDLGEKENERFKLFRR